MTKKITPVLLLALGTLFLVGAESCSGSSNKNTVRPADTLSNNANRTESSCSNDADCTKTRADCCGCTAGGKQIAVLKTAEKQILAAIDAEKGCGQTMCAMMMSDDSSCKKSPKCEDSQCVLK